MQTTVFVIDTDDGNGGWVAPALASPGYVVEFVDDRSTLAARLRVAGTACLVMFAEPDTASVLRLVREVRQCVPDLPVIVLGPHSAFRTAMDIARLPATDFLELPVSGRQLRLAIGKVLKGAPDRQQ